MAALAPVDVGLRAVGWTCFQSPIKLPQTLGGNNITVATLCAPVKMNARQCFANALFCIIKSGIILIYVHCTAAPLCIVVLDGLSNHI